MFLTSHYLAIVMDYVAGGDLSQLIDLQWQQGVRVGAHFLALQLVNGFLVMSTLAV